ncbi:hypothetical protein DCC62_10285 [candidate division KSB1 bacterium]|nr:MAG: hypothetical protein DCC62_10285 [candidate division KSB1 bacterium]
MMPEFHDTKPETNVQEAEYKRLLGYPRHYEITGRSRELADWARQWYAENGKPWIYVRQADQLDILNARLSINGVVFSSTRLHEQWYKAQAHTAILAAVSAGKECEEKARQLWLEEKPDEYFFLEIYGSAVVEHLITNAGARLCAWAEQQGMAILPHYSPGYPEWDIADQRNLLDLIRQKEFPEEIHVLETGMLRPKKSLLAVFGVTPHVNRVRSLRGLVPCESCSMLSCQYRRMPYGRARKHMEDVSQLQASVDRISNGTARIKSALDHHGKYSISVRALQKWSQERLHLNVLADRSVQVRFRYAGTTCCNEGRPLEYDYHLKLASATEGYRIIEMSCAPAPGDNGHAHMCEYIRNSEELERAIADEKPLLGCSLNEVLHWNRQFSPSGCYCDAASREHKWGMALEVIHYALVQDEKRRNAV